MKGLSSLGGLALALIPAAALAQQPEACQRVEFSEQVLERFPNIRNACLDVISRDGQQFAVVRANLVRTRPRRMVVRVRLPDGTQTEPMGINVGSNERVNIGGRLVPISEVAVGQELSAYIHVTDPGIALASESTGPVEFTPITAEPEPEPEPAATVAETPQMPKTATNLPLAGTIGALLLALGAGLAFLRRRARA